MRTYKSSYVVAVLLFPLAPSAFSHPSVVLGGIGGLPSLSNPNASSAFRATPSSGIYLHFNATDPTFFSSTMRQYSEGLCRKPVVVEISLGGGFAPPFWTAAWKTNVTGYGFEPRIAVVNVAMEQAEAPAGAPEIELKAFEAFAKSGKTEGGLQILAPLFLQIRLVARGLRVMLRRWAIAHTWSDPWWDRLRTMALFGGGIAFDAPPAFFLRGLPDQAQIKAYQAFTIAGLRWAADHHLWSTFIISPYFDGVAFQRDSENAYRILLDADALPQTWIVENYNLCGPPFPRACTVADPSFLAPVGRGRHSEHRSVGRPLVCPSCRHAEAPSRNR